MDLYSSTGRNRAPQGAAPPGPLSISAEPQKGGVLPGGNADRNQNDGFQETEIVRIVTVTRMLIVATLRLLILVVLVVYE